MGRDDDTIEMFGTTGRGEAVARERVLPPYVRASKTSREAAVSMIGHAPTQERSVEEFIRSQGSLGALDDEIEVALGLRHQAASARRNALVRKGKVKDSGETRKTRSGRNATVWVVTEP